MQSGQKKRRGEKKGVIHTVRESPPPTPREAYLPQRPERAQKREASEMRLTHPLAGRRARKTKQSLKQSG